MVTSAPSLALVGLTRLRFAGHLCGCEGDPERCKGPSTVAGASQIKACRGARASLESLKGAQGQRRGQGNLFKGTLSGNMMVAYRVQGRCTGLEGRQDIYSAGIR